MRILKKLNPHVAGIKPYEPGRPIEDLARELGLDPAGIIKLASNESALGPSPAAIAAIRSALSECHRYPDGGAYILRQKLAAKFGLAMDQVLVGNGSNEILELVGHCFLTPGRSAVFSQYAFVVYKLVSLLMGCEIREVPANQGLGHDLIGMRQAIDDTTSVVFLCCPNNPTGTLLTPESFTAFMDSVSEDVLVVVDEAYAEIVQGTLPDALPYILADRPVLITRTFSKAYGLAGLRLGYALGNARLIQALNQARQPFNCNLLAQIGGAAALDDESFVKRNRDLCTAARDYLEQQCHELKLPFIPSSANFMLIEVGDGARVFQRLQELGVIVRPMAGYGLPQYIRVTYGTAAENARLVTSLKRVL